MVSTEETEIVETNWEDEYFEIIKKIVSLRKVITESSIDLNRIVLDDFNFGGTDIDEYLQQVEALLTLSAGELPDDKKEGLNVIEGLDDEKILTKVNLVRKFIEKFPLEEEGARLLIETAAKVYIVLNDRYIAEIILEEGPLMLFRYARVLL